MRLLWTIAAAILLLAAPPGSVPPAEPLFIEAAAKTGLAFTHVNGAGGRYYIAEQMGSGAALFDYDHDGWLDLFVANGAVNIVESLRGQPNPYRMKNQLFRNTGDKRFVETTGAAGPAFDTADVGRGAAFGDVDNDGDVDIVATSNGGRVRLLLNQTADHHWLQVRLQQGAGNRFGLGARVVVERAGRPGLSRRVKTDGSYLSASDIRAHFGLGTSSKVDAVVVTWPDGQMERWTAPPVDRILTLRRGERR